MSFHLFVESDRIHPRMRVKAEESGKEKVGMLVELDGADEQQALKSAEKYIAESNFVEYSKSVFIVENGTLIDVTSTAEKRKKDTVERMEKEQLKRLFDKYGTPT